MRAGSLSDARVVAMLRQYFVCVHMPELITKDLIAEPADAALLEHYHAELLERSRTGMPDPGLHGGEREVFFTPDGALLDIFLSLGTQGSANSQFTRAGRAAHEDAVQRFFGKAAKALLRTRAALPEDWQALLAGTAPAVAAVRALPIPQPPLARGSQHLRVSVRSDVIMYEALVGTEIVALSAEEVRALLPDQPAPRSARAWPASLTRRLLRTFHPRGGGVLIALDDASIDGSIETVVEECTGAEVRGRLRGHYCLAPKTQSEKGRRFDHFERAEGDLRGDFVFDRASGVFTSLRLSSEGGVRFSWPTLGPDAKPQVHLVGVELIKCAGS